MSTNDPPPYSMDPPGVVPTHDDKIGMRDPGSLPQASPQQPQLNQYPPGGQYPPGQYNYPHPPPQQQPPPQAAPSGPVFMVNGGGGGNQQMITGNCPVCKVGHMSEKFTCFGIFLAIFCFPFGFICCCLMTKKVCGNCGACFG